MKSHQLVGSRPRLKVIVGTVVALGALTASAPAALAAPAHAAGSAHPGIIRPDAETSIFVAYSKENFNGTVTDINGCGGHNMPYPVGSYEWIARGQSSFLYNETNEGGSITGRLGAGTNADSPDGVGWKSIFIIC